MITFVGALCSFASLEGANSEYTWIPLTLTGVGLFLFLKGILKSSEEYYER